MYWSAVVSTPYPRHQLDLPDGVPDLWSAAGSGTDNHCLLDNIDTRAASPLPLPPESSVGQPVIQTSDFTVNWMGVAVPK